MPIPQDWIAKRCCKQFIFFMEFSYTYISSCTSSNPGHPDMAYATLRYQTIISKASDNNPEKYLHNLLLSRRQNKSIKHLTDDFKSVIVKLTRKNYLDIF
jgi:hypothetical protein